MKHYNFPMETFMHINILQHLFGPQQIVYGAKLSKEVTLILNYISS